MKKYLFWIIAVIVLLTAVQVPFGYRIRYKTSDGKWHESFYTGDSKGYENFLDNLGVDLLGHGEEFITTFVQCVDHEDGLKCEKWSASDLLIERLRKI